MGTFSQLVRGRAARKRGVVFPTLTGQEMTCDLRILTGADDSEVLAAATAAAKSAGAEPREGNIVFDFERAVQNVARACVDPESPEEAPRPFFDGGAEQVRRELDRERIFLLSEQQILFQHSVSPRQRGPMSTEEFIQHVYEMAHAGETDELPFERWAPSLQRSFTRTLAVQFMNLVDMRSPSSSASGTTDGASTPTSQH